MLCSASLPSAAVQAVTLMSDDLLEGIKGHRELRAALEAFARRDHNWLLSILLLHKKHDLLLRVLPSMEAALPSVEIVNTIESAEHFAQLFFTVIVSLHGRDAVRRILLELAEFYSPPSMARRNQVKKESRILAMYDDEPNVQQLALRLATQNKTFPKELRWGPQGTQNPMTMDKYIRRLLKAREQKLKRVR
jgi:hypothetical protein